MFIKSHCTGKKEEPKFKLGEIVRPAENPTLFSKVDTTNWSFKLYTIPEVNNDALHTKLTYKMPQRYNEAL